MLARARTADAGSTVWWRAENLTNPHYHGVPILLFGEARKWWRSATVWTSVCLETEQVKPVHVDGACGGLSSLSLSSVTVRALKKKECSTTYVSVCVCADCMLSLPFSSPHDN